MQVNIHEAKTQLSRLVDRAAGGEEIVIARAGKPVAKLVAYEPVVDGRVLGAWRGLAVIAPDFDDMDPEIARLFDGEDHGKGDGPGQGHLGEQQ